MAQTQTFPISQSLNAAQFLRRVSNKLRLPLPLFKALNRKKARFECPLCSYDGPFVDFSSFGGVRKHAICPQCGSLERHRLQYVVAMRTLPDASAKEVKMLHFAPEAFLKPIFVKRFSKYETADLFMKGVDHTVDIQHLPFEDASYDIVFCSHVLEHIRDDRQAIKEIRRVLRPNGVAVLPVPIVCDKTIEYADANPHEGGHVRAPGLDYFDRYREYFRKVDTHTSESYPEKYQLFTYEDRSRWPTRECPLRPPMPGWKHTDFVPVCYV